MVRRFNRDIAARPSARVSPELADAARTADLVAEDPDPAPAESAVSPALSDAAAVLNPRISLEDRLATADAGAISPGDGETSSDGVGGATAALGSLAAAPTGAAATISQVQEGLADRLVAPSLTDGPGRVDAETAVAQAEAGLPGSALRSSSNSMLFDEASNDTTPNGIAEQGSGAVSDQGSSEGSTSLFTKEGRVAFMKGLLGGDSDAPVGTRDGADGVEASGPKVDVSAVDPRLRAVSSVFQSSINQVDAVSEDSVVKVTPDGTRIHQTTSGTRVAEMANGKVVRVEPDGTKTVIEADKSTTTLHPDGEVTETAAPKPGVSIPDPEGGGEQFRFVSEGLKGRLAPRGVEGDGDIDFGDDIPFGVGAGAQIVDQQGVLLGDAGRAGAVVEGPATSGFTGLDPVRSSGAIDFLDESPIGGGLEDDPLAGSRTDQNLDGGLGSSDEDDDEDSSDTADGTA